jgi:hypothetical protein
MTTARKTQTTFSPESISDLKNTRYLKKTFGQSPKAFERAKYVLHRIYVGRRDRHGYVRLSAKSLAREVGGTNSWGKLSKALIEGGWIKKDRCFVVGQKSQGYDLGGKVEKQKWIESGEREIPPDNKGPKIEGLEIDLEAALSTLEGLRLGPRSKASIQSAIERFSARYGIGQKTGRLFTCANRLPSAIRKHLTIGGNPTCEIDVTNCQPLLMATLYPNRNSSEALAYQTLVENGMLYESIMSATSYDRKRAKQAFVVWLGGGMAPKIEGYFRSHWPELAEICQNLKRGQSEALCHLTQRLESNIFVKEFSARYSGSYVSIHDGILLESNRREEGVGILKRIFRDRHGLSPSIH